MMKARFLVIWVLISLVLAACGTPNKDHEQDETLMADADEDFTVEVGKAPIFDACGSTGDITNYRWTILVAPEAKAQDNGKIIRDIEADCKFTLEGPMAIEELGNWVIQLEVSNDGGQTMTDTVTVTVKAKQ